MATWPSGKAEACKAFIPGSNPGVASIPFSFLSINPLIPWRTHEPIRKKGCLSHPPEQLIFFFNKDPEFRKTLIHPGFIWAACLGWTAKLGRNTSLWINNHQDQ